MILRLFCVLFFSAARCLGTWSVSLRYTSGLLDSWSAADALPSIFHERALPGRIEIFCQVFFVFLPCLLLYRCFWCTSWSACFAAPLSFYVLVSFVVCSALWFPGSTCALRSYSHLLFVFGLPPHVEFSVLRSALVISLRQWSTRCGRSHLRHLVQTTATLQNLVCTPLNVIGRYSGSIRTTPIILHLYTIVIINKTTLLFVGSYSTIWTYG